MTKEEIDKQKLEISASAEALNAAVDNEQERKLTQNFFLSLIAFYTIENSPIEHEGDNLKKFLCEMFRFFLSAFSMADYSTTKCKDKNYLKSYNQLSSKTKGNIINYLNDFKGSFIPHPELIGSCECEMDAYIYPENKYAVSQINNLIDALNNKPLLC